MKIDEKGVSGLPKCTENPFLKEAVEEIQNSIVRKYVNSSGNDRKAVLNMVDGETGEVLKTSFVRQMRVDEEQFTKVYINHFASFFELSKTAIRVFGYIMKCMKPAKDQIYLSHEEAMKYTGYTSPKSVYKGLMELAKANIIARSSLPNIWYINPMLFFNGSRVTFVDEYINEKAEALRQSENRKMLEEQKRIESSVNQIDEQ
jgi:hypothetical protein